MKTAERAKTADRRLFEGKLTTVVMSFLAVALLATFVLLVWQKSTQRLDTADYDGKIVDRWADYVESNQGSRPRFRLLIESHDGKRFTVRVDPNVYESSKVGMHIKRRSGQTVLIEADRGIPVDK